MILAFARAEGIMRKMLARLKRVDALVIDGWAMVPLQETGRCDFWEIGEDRCQTGSTILTSQTPVVQWHKRNGEATLADGILDRLVHHAHRFESRR